MSKKQKKNKKTQKHKKKQKTQKTQWTSYMLNSETVVKGFNLRRFGIPSHMQRSRVFNRKPCNFSQERPFTRFKAYRTRTASGGVALSCNSTFIPKDTTYFVVLSNYIV